MAELQTPFGGIPTDKEAPKAEYVLEKKHPSNKDLLIFRQVSTGEKFLGTVLPNTPSTPSEEVMQALTTRAHGGAFDALKNLLNHEHLVNLQDVIVHEPLRSENESKRVVLWDWCDGGRLHDLLEGAAPSEILERRDEQEGFLPEGMCWDVLLGVLRALMWIHEGRREVYSFRGRIVDSNLGLGLLGDDERRVKKAREKSFRGLENVKGYEKIRSVSSPEKDWWPVLHRGISARNISFQKPRGIETYGLVKLGGFGEAYVSGTVAGGQIGAGIGPVAGDWVGDVETEVVREARKKIMREGRAAVEKARRPYHTGTEIYHLGRVLFQMMTGFVLPPEDECPECGCWHLDFSPPKREGLFGTIPPPPGTPAAHPPCPHTNCPNHDVKVFRLYSEMHDGYSHALRSRVVEMLLGLRIEVKGAARNVLGVAWEEYLDWRRNTEEGRLHRDLWDDLWAREVSSSWKRAEAMEELLQVGKEVDVEVRGLKRKVDEEDEDEYDEVEWDGSKVRRTERGLEIIAIQSDSD